MTKKLNDTYFPAAVVGKGFLAELDGQIWLLTYNFKYDDSHMCLTYVSLNDITNKQTKIVDNDEILHVFVPQ